MPAGEQMFFYHGLSGPCPKPPLIKNEYRPWEELGISELEYWKKRYLEMSAANTEIDTLRAQLKISTDALEFIDDKHSLASDGGAWLKAREALGKIKEMGKCIHSTGVGL